MSRDSSKSGSALIMVLAVASVLAYLVADFGVGMRSELKAAGGHYDEALNVQLARSAIALARLELNRPNTDLYSDERGNAYLVPRQEDYASAVEALQVYREGFQMERGQISYRIIHKPFALDPNALSAAAWHRLLEVACDIEEGDERNALVDAVLDWIDIDDLSRANGAEEEFYQALDPPRHARNGPLVYPQEVLLVYGFTPAMLYGYASPVRIDSGMMAGGGLLRYFDGDASPEGRATRRYVLNAIVPTTTPDTPDEPLDFKKLESKPNTLTVIAEGFMPVVSQGELEDDLTYGEPSPMPQRVSRHIILMKLGRTGNDGRYRILDMQNNAPTETLQRILAYGVPEEDDSVPQL